MIAAISPANLSLIPLYRPSTIRAPASYNQVAAPASFSRIVVCNPSKNPRTAVMPSTIAVCAWTNAPVNALYRVAPNDSSASHTLPGSAKYQPTNSVT